MARAKEHDNLRPWQLKLNEVIFGTETPAGKWFDIILLVLIVVSIVGVMLDSVPSIHEVHGEKLFYFDWILTIAFTIEYLARIVSVKSPLKYMLSFYGLIDLLSILPTYLGIFVSGTGALRVLRSVRLIRIFRILKLGAFVDDSRKLGAALKASRNKIIVFLFVILALVIIMGTIMYIVEGGESGFTSIPRSIYWAIVTLTTVGYGDIAPATPLGQFIASVIMILGYAIIAVPTGIVTNELMAAEDGKGKSLSNHACQSCGKDGHDANAKYCKHCGEKL